MNKVILVELVAYHERLADGCRQCALDTPSAADREWCEREGANHARWAEACRVELGRMGERAEAAPETVRPAADGRKTAHQFARELLAGPDLPIYHFDPSCAGMDDERDTSIAAPKVEQVNLRECEDPDDVVEMEAAGCNLDPFLTIVADREPFVEASEYDSEILIRLQNAGLVTAAQVAEAAAAAQAYFQEQGRA